MAFDLESSAPFKVCYDRYDAQLVQGEEYLCRLTVEESLNSSERGPWSFVFTRRSISKSTALKMSLWTQFYLENDLTELKLKKKCLKKSQMVVAVDQKNRLVRRGLFRGFESDTSVQLYLVDEGITQEFSIKHIYATTQAAAMTPAIAFQGYLYGHNVFHGSDLLEVTIERFRKLFPPGLCLNANVKVSFVGFKYDRIPVVDIWLLDNQHPCFKTLAYNRVVARDCLAVWNESVKQNKIIGSAYPGDIAYVNENGRMFLHLFLKNSDRPAVLLESYLRSFAVDDLELTCKRYTKVELTVQEVTAKSKMFLAYNYKDDRLFRCTIVELLYPGAYVSFIDYGNMAFISYDYLFAASEVDPFLEQILPLVWEAHMCSVEKLSRSNSDAINKYFDGLANEGYEFTFTVRDGYSGSYPLVSIKASHSENTDFDVVKEIIDKRLAIRRRKRYPTGRSR